jgi:hypothetical protein
MKTVIDKVNELDVDIDWSKAPDDCVGAVESNDPYATYPFGMFVKKHGGFNGYQYCHEQEAYPCMEAFTFISRPQPTPIYTQEMADNGVLPSVGVMVDLIIFENLTSLGHIEFKNEVGFLFRYKENNLCDFIEFSSDVAFKPLTPPITLIDGDCYSYNYFGPKKGFYNKAINRLVSLQGSSDPLGVTNIQPLTVEK